MDDNDFHGMAFMFDSEHERTELMFNFEDDNVGTIKLKSIGDNPGHLQSGQYIWPAAEYASTYMIDHWASLKCSRVLELGSGCGLTGLVISRLDGVSHVYFTDYDYGCLKLIDENIILNNISCPCSTVMLEWGNFTLLQDLVISDMLIIGSDLLYAVEICQPLLSTVNHLLSNGAVLFVLVSSFDVGQVIEDHMISICHTLSIQIEEKVMLDVSISQYRVQYFRKL